MKSVIIPVTKPDYAKKTVEALRANDGDFEIIVVCDGCEVDIPGIRVVAFKRSDDKNHAGPVRNLGAKHAKGKRLIFLDDDMVVPKDFIKRHSKGIVLGLRKPDFWNDFFGFFDDINELENKWLLFHSHNFSIDKGLFEKVGGFSGDYTSWGMEDIDLGYRLRDEEWFLDKELVCEHMEHPKEVKGKGKGKHSIVEMHNIFYEKYKDPLIKKSFSFEKKVNLKIFDKCNNNCYFCKWKGELMPFDEIKTELEDAKKYGVAVKISGGEALMHPEFEKVLDFIEKEKIDVELSTNGRMFSYPKFAQKVSKAIKNYSVSVFGWGDGHDRITKVKGSFEQTLKGIDNLRNLGATVVVDAILDESGVRKLDRIKTLGNVCVRYIPKFDYNNFFNNYHIVNKSGLTTNNSFFKCRDDYNIRQCTKCEIRKYCKGNRNFFSEKIVFFRDDDITELTDELRKLVNIFIRNKVPLDLAVVPGLVTNEAVEYLNNFKKKHPEIIFIHQHGYMHKKFDTDPKHEFGPARSYKEQFDDIKKGKELMKKFNEVDNIFTPPYNNYNDDTIKALKKLGFDIISSSHGYSDSVRMVNIDVDVMDWNTYVFRDYDEIDKESDEKLKKNKLLGILFHHERFSDKDFEFIERLVKRLKKHKVKNILEVYG